MDDNAKNASSYHLDQEILDARGINMTVEEVAGLPTTKYSERVQSLLLCDEDLAILKGLRRRIKNRLASQNSRRRSMEHLRRLTRELRAVRACREDALAERRVLALQRDEIRERCQRLRTYLAQTLRDRADDTKVPTIVIDTPESPLPPKDKTTEHTQPAIDNLDRNVFECRIDKLVQKSVNHIFNNNKKVFAKTVFIGEKALFDSDVGGGKEFGGGKDFGGFRGQEGGALNLSIKKEGRRKSHGRKQSAPRRIAIIDHDVSDCVLDLKIKKEPE